MTIVEEKRDLFTVSNDYVLAHCISADYALGAGIALEFQSRFGLREHLKWQGDNTYPSVIFINGVYNLVTKEKYWNKPTYDSLDVCLWFLKDQMKWREHSKIAMPKIGCGLDRLKWDKVKKMIETNFQYTEIEILICYQ